MVEFTGERLVPGQVENDLFNEHYSRYRFCSSLVRGLRCLDAGCGLGYGTAVLAESATSVVGIDNHAPTVAEATRLYRRDNLHFAVADVQALPWETEEFDCAVSFEVVEHLKDPAALVDALRKVTKPGGLIILSTPNRDAYKVSRGEAGPNPFHHHEFTLAEFRELLSERFAYIRIFAQNHTPSITFRQERPDRSHTVFAPADREAANLDTAQFFVAVCSQAPLPEMEDAVYIADSGNVLFEREAHIRLLNTEIQLKTSWLEDAHKNLAELHAAHQSLQEEHDRRSAWAMDTIHEMEATNRRLAEQLDAKCKELQTAVDRLNGAEATIVDRSAWAQRLDAELAGLREEYEHLTEEHIACTRKCGELRVTIETLQGPHDELLMGYARLRSDYATDLQALAYLAGIQHPAAKPRLVPPEMRSEQEFEEARQLYAELEKRVALLRLHSRQLELALGSRWLKLGRRLGFGPRVDDRQQES